MALINTTTTGVLGSTFFGDGAGSLTVQQNGVTLGTYGNIPAFSAHITTSQTAAADAYTKIQFATERFDTNNNYDNSTYRFTPTVAGYYFVSASTYQASYTGGGFVSVSIFKSGSNFQEVQRLSPSTNPSTIGGSCLVYLNGTTDYIEAYFYAANGTTILVGGNGAALSHFDAILLKAA